MNDSRAQRGRCSSTAFSKAVTAGQVPIGFPRGLPDRFASLGQAVTTPALSRPTDGNVDVLVVARGDPVRNA